MSQVVEVAVVTVELIQDQVVKVVVVLVLKMLHPMVAVAVAVEPHKTVHLMLPELDIKE
jgi:hypothetical protein